MVLALIDENIVYSNFFVKNGPEKNRAVFFTSNLFQKFRKSISEKIHAPLAINKK